MKLHRLHQALPTGRCSRIGTALGLALLIVWTSGAQAGEILAAHFRLLPARPYIGQPFELRLEVEVTPGAELQDLQLEGVPLDSFAKLGAYQTGERQQARRGDATVDILPFVATGRAMQPAQQEFQGVLHARLVERTSMGFFSSVRSVSASVRLEPLRVEFRSLPTLNMPSGFQGAIGSFTLSGTLDPAQAAPGDLVNLTYTVTGHGWLGATQVLLPPPDANFRIYPPQETQRAETDHLALQQVIVPLTSNATHIGAARFPYFDPEAGIYREAIAGPFHLMLTSPQAPGSIPAIKHFDAQPGPVSPAEAGDAAVAVTMNQARHLLPFAAVCLLAMIIASLLYGWRPRLAIAIGILLFLAGTYLCHQWQLQSHSHGREVRELVAARLCPSSNARVLFHITPGLEVTPQEVAEDWVRIDCNGRYGWIPMRTLKP